MYEKLVKLLDNSCSEYSNFKVAAILIDNDGNEHSGVNVESASFGATSCAERNAIFSAISFGVKRKNIKEIHLIALKDKKKNNDFNIMPCGICRQVMMENMGNDSLMFSYNFATKNVEKFFIKDLMIKPFLDKDLL